MNEYLVSVYIAEDHSLQTSQLVEAEDKPMAIAKAVAECNAKGLKTYGYDYCDFCG